MFETVEIENDLKFVDEAIRNYWGLKKNTTKKESK